MCYCSPPLIPQWSLGALSPHPPLFLLSQTQNPHKQTRNSAAQNAVMLFACVDVYIVKCQRNIQVCKSSYLFGLLIYRIHAITIKDKDESKQTTFVRCIIFSRAPLSHFTQPRHSRKGRGLWAAQGEHIPLPASSWWEGGGVWTFY